MSTGLDAILAEVERLLEIRAIAKNQLSHIADFPPRDRQPRVQNRHMLGGKRVRPREIPCDPFDMGVIAVLHGLPKKTYHASGQPRPHPYGCVCGREWTIETNRRLPSTGAYNETDDGTQGEDA
jgi:hypothetical protein